MKRAEKIKLLQSIIQGNKQAVKTLATIRVSMNIDWSTLEMDFGSGINGPNEFLPNSSIVIDSKQNDLSLNF